MKRDNIAEKPIDGFKKKCKCRLQMKNYKYACANHYQLTSDTQRVIPYPMTSNANSYPLPTNKAYTESTTTHSIQITRELPTTSLLGIPTQLPSKMYQLTRETYTGTYYPLTWDTQRLTRCQLPKDTSAVSYYPLTKDAQIYLSLFFSIFSVNLIQNYIEQMK